MVTDSPVVASRVSALRNYGASVPAWERHLGQLHRLPEYDQAGFNFKLTDIQASIGLEQLKKLPAIIQMRREIARRYDEALAGLGWLRLPREPAGATHAYQSYVCMLRIGTLDGLGAATQRRDRLWHHLGDRGIASVQGAQAMPMIAYYHRRYGWEPRDYPIAFAADQASVALPIYPGLSQNDQARVVESLRSFQP